MITMVHAVDAIKLIRVTYRFPKTPEELIQISGLLHTTKTVRGFPHPINLKTSANEF